MWEAASLPAVIVATMIRPAHIEESTEVPPHDGATVGRLLKIVGELSGSEALYIEGQVEGGIHLPENKVTVGPSGQVSAHIVAREIVVLGLVRGDCYATERVEVSGNGSITGNVVAARVSIELGAYVQGGVETRQFSQARQVAVEGSTLAASYDARAEESIELGRFQTLEEGLEVEDILPTFRSPQHAFAHRKTAIQAY
jgi:cytoskeletal protein CcmA (bactofilin family)